MILPRQIKKEFSLYFSFLDLIKNLLIHSDGAPNYPAKVPLSLYYFHHSHCIGTSHIFQNLNGDDYTFSSRVMVIALSIKNKLGFIDKSIIMLDDNNLIIS